MNILGCRLALAGVKIHGVYLTSYNSDKIMQSVNIELWKTVVPESSVCYAVNQYYTVVVENGKVDQVGSIYSRTASDSTKEEIRQIFSSYLTTHTVAELHSELAKV